MNGNALIATAKSAKVFSKSCLLPHDRRCCCVRLLAENDFQSLNDSGAEARQEKHEILVNTFEF